MRPSLQVNVAREEPEYNTFVGGCVCCGSGGCSVVPMGSSNRGLVREDNTRGDRSGGVWKATLTLSANNPEFKTQGKTGTKELMVEPLGKHCSKRRHGHPGIHGSSFPS